MAAGQFYRGRNLRISVEGEVIYHATECSFSTSKDFEEIATKDTNGKEQYPGDHGWSLSTNYLVADRPGGGTQQDVSTLLGFYQNNTLLTVEFTTGVTGDIVISGSAYIDNCNITSTVNQVVSGDFSFLGNGDFTVGTVA
ncbi:MAG: hypothetical protein AAF934_00080 [Bacteroidota bacterium]